MWVGSVFWGRERGSCGPRVLGLGWKYGFPFPFLRLRSSVSSWLVLSWWQGCSWMGARLVGSVGAPPRATAWMWSIWFAPGLPHQWQMLLCSVLVCFFSLSQVCCLIPRLWVADSLPLIRRYSVQPVGWCWSQWLFLVANLPQRGVVQRDGGVLGMVGWSFLFGYERSAVWIPGCLDPAALLGVWLLAGGVGFL